MKSEEKITGSRAPKKRVTWTFQPDEDIVSGINALTGGRALSKGDRTRLIKKALEFQYPEAFLSIAKKRLEDSTSEVARLEKLILGKKSALPSSREASEIAAFEAREMGDLERRHNKR